MIVAVVSLIELNICNLLQPQFLLAVWRRHSTASSMRSITPLFFYHWFEHTLFSCIMTFEWTLQIIIFPRLKQETMLGQHASLLSGDPLLLQQHAQIPVSISTSQPLTIPTATMHIENPQQNHPQMPQNQSESQTMQPQNQQQQIAQMNPQQNLVQVQVQDNLVSVIEDSKDQKELIAAQLAEAHMQISENQHLHQQTMTLQHLHVQQALDSVVRMENAVENHQPGHAQSQNGGENAENINENIQIVKDEKIMQNCTRLLGAQFGLQDLKANLMDVKTADGSIVKITTPFQDQDLAKTLGVEMVQNMYKVNVDDLNQLLAYHEVFGKLQNEINSSGQGNLVQNNVGNVGNVQSNVVQNNIAIVAQKTIGEEQEASTSVQTESPPAIVAGSHVCDICGKMFQFRYQLIVHRRYHTERKPFTCQVCV